MNNITDTLFDDIKVKSNNFIADLCWLENIKFKRANLQHSIMRLTEIHKCEFDATDFSFSTFRDGSFNQCVFNKTVFNKAKLSLVEFTSCTELEKENYLLDAIIDKSVTFDGKAINY